MALVVDNGGSPWRRCSGWAMPGHGLFVGAAAVGVTVTLITEGLSLGHLLTPGGLGASWALAAAIGLWAFRRRRHDGPPVARATPMPVVALGAIGTILAVTGAIAFLAPPNTWDSMTYHMPRVAHWSQAGSVAHYPTHILRQLWLGPGAEFAIAHLYVLTGGDRLANLPQWLAFAACVAGTAIVAGELGGGASGRALAAVACATLPMAIAQASSTQNDLVASFWLLSLGYGVLHFRMTPSAGTAALVGVSAGLAVLTKPHMGFLAVPWLLVFIWTAGSRCRRRAAGWILVAGMCAVALDAGHAGRNALLLLRSGAPSAQSASADRPDGFSPVWSYHMNTTLDPRAVASNALRNIALHLVTPSDRVNDWIGCVIVRVHRTMRIDPNDSRTTMVNAEFRVGPFGLHEDVSGNPLHLLAGLMAGMAIWSRRDAFGASRRLWVCLSLASAIVFIVALKWQVWNSRLHLPLFVLLCPLIGVTLENRHRLAAAWGTSFCVLALVSLAVTWPRPLIGPDSVLTMPRTAQQFRSRPQAPARLRGRRGRAQRHAMYAGGPGTWHERLGISVLAAPPGRARLGPDVRMEHVLVQNASGRLVDRALGPPCALLVVGDAFDGAVDWRGRTFVERWRSMPVRVYGTQP